MILKYLKSISNLSFIFLIADFLLLITEHKPAGEYIFIWMIIFSAALNIEKHINIYYKTLLLIILILPVLFIKVNTDKLIVIIIFSVVFYLNRENKNKFSYGETAEEFKKSFFVITAVLLISGIYLNKAAAGRYILPYMVYYIVFTVPYLRYLRNYEHNVVNKKLNKINTIYFIGIITASVIFSLKSVRKYIIDIFLLVYSGIAEVFLYIFSMIFLVLSNLLNKIHFKQINIDIFKLNGKKPKLINPSDTDYGLSNPLLIKIFIIIFNAVLILTALYVIKKVLKKKFKALPEAEKCEETKEFIFYEKHSARKKTELFIFGDYYSQIKYYYRKMMKDAVSKGVNIKGSDTTLDIFLKSKEIFDVKSMGNMRDIYINIRYGNKACTKGKAKEFRNLYKNRNFRRNK